MNLLTPILAPLGLALAAAVAYADRGAPPKRAFLASRVASLLAVGVTAGSAGAVAMQGPLVLAAPDALGAGALLRIDGLAVLMLGLVATLGAVLTRFSENYLRGERRQGAFLAQLSLTTASVMVLVLSANLVLLVGAWIATSLALHRLLVFYPDRGAAIVAARKKFIVARTGDACLVTGAFLLQRSLGSTDLATLQERARAFTDIADAPLGARVAAVLVVCTALLKAAQFPFHGWLTEMQETPTPVSALLHAGILNGGTFLVVRLADVVQLSTTALCVLVVVGGFTAAFACLVMITEARVKTSLAYSSAAHMGFMLFLCSVGAYTVATVHLVAHSLYKAYAFLSSGSAASSARERSDAQDGSRLAVPAGLVVAAAIVWSAASLSGLPVFGSTRGVVLAAVLTFGLAHLVAQALRDRPSAIVVGGAVVAAGGVAASFFVLEHVGFRVLRGAVAVPRSLASSTAALAATVLAVFTAIAVFQRALPARASSRAVRRGYVLMKNGFYANAVVDRVVGAWSVATERSEGTARRAPRVVDGVSSAVAIRAAVRRATVAVAPVWPLQHFVAVNPFLGLSTRSFRDAAHWLARTAGARMTMPRAFYGEAATPGSDAQPRPLPTVADVAGRVSGRDWPRLVTERVGAWAATFFDQGQADWPSPWRRMDAYVAWREEAVLDATPEIFGARGFRDVLRRSPPTAAEAIEVAVARLRISPSMLDAYLQRLLYTVGGWSAYARHAVWQQELRGGSGDAVEQMLAIRLTWELALFEALRGLGIDQAWADARSAYADTEDDGAIDAGLDLHEAYERRVQDDLCEKLAAPRASTASSARPKAQAVFCIDVRSEVFRRSFEEVDAGYETLGFAGFFGCAVEYVPLAAERGRDQCPVLLAPSVTVAEEVVGGDRDATRRAVAARSATRNAEGAWAAFKGGAVSCFSFVGPVGLAYGPKLVTASLGRDPSLRAASAASDLAPSLDVRTVSGRRYGLSETERVAMAEGFLRGMSLTSGFARVVLIIGHGASVVNNPHAAGLACGACGGHAGDVNARIAATLLNQPFVRLALAKRGIEVPADTVFVAGLHDTTTDEVQLFDTASLPATHAPDVEALRLDLLAASARARRLRAPLLAAEPDDRGERSIVARSRDWSQVRPEWGLAGCAAFVVAPRGVTKGIDLGGRAFLHSYDWEKDEGYAVLEAVMTAPMVVGSWINLQYYASSVDNRVFGCGNKVLHNVVGTIGVLEGNGGDLRVGLPWQSVHDGHRLVHDPVRLNVFIQAPADAMNGVLEKHPSLRALVDNGWIHLFALGASGSVTERYVGELRWEPMPAPRMEVAA